MFQEASAIWVFQIQVRKLQFDRGDSLHDYQLHQTLRGEWGGTGQVLSGRDARQSEPQADTMDATTDSHTKGSKSERER